MAKLFESIYSKPIGLDKKIKLLLEKPALGISTKEIESLNTKLREQEKLFPHLLVEAHADKVGGKVSIDFTHTPRVKKTTVDKIDDLIKSEKAKLKKR